MEGLKTELKATRNTNDSLRRQVKQLKGVLRLHGPSLLLGVAAGVLVKAYASVFRRLFQGRGGDKPQQQQDGQGEAVEAAAGGEGGATAAAAGAAPPDPPPSQGAPQLT